MKNYNVKLKTIAKRYLNFAFCILNFEFRDGFTRYINFDNVRFLSRLRRNSRSCITGFTLLEMIISIGIFSVIVISAIGITLGISNAQIKSANITAILDNIRFSLELITKEMRTGNSYALTDICTSPGSKSEISFENAQGEKITYFLNGANKRIMKARGTIITADCDGSTGKVIPFSAEEVTAERLTFLLTGAASGPNDGQPRITLTLKVKSANPKFELESSMDLVTTVVQRFRDL